MTKQETATKIASLWQSKGMKGSRFVYEDCVDWAVSLQSLGVNAEKAIEQAMEDYKDQTEDSYV